MQGLLALARGIDWLNSKIGRAVYWLVLVVALISASNAVMRYSLDISSNAWLELQWYLFSAIFLFCAPYTLLKNDMVRIDVVSGRLSQRTRMIIEIIGTLFFLLPMAIGLMVMSWPVFMQALERHEVSSNAGGLLIWPARLMVPIGFFLLALQGVSQLIKVIAFLRGEGPDPTDRGQVKTAEQELAEEIARLRGEQA
jgi:TRAP-type mannitol/chloroaromatic compound transport system permease small subunit